MSTRAFIWPLGTSLHHEVMFGELHIHEQGIKSSPCHHIASHCLFCGARSARVSSVAHVHVAHGLGLAPPPSLDYRPLCSDAALIYLILENLLAALAYVPVDVLCGTALLKFSLLPQCLERVAISLPLSCWSRV